MLRHRETAGDWLARLAAVVLLASGLSCVFRSLFHRFNLAAELTNSFLPLGTIESRRIAALLIGLLLVYESFHLWRRKKTAWYVAVLVLSAGAALHLYHHHFPTASVLLLALLAALRKHFSVRTEPKSILYGLLGAAGIIGFALGLGVLGFELLDKRDFGIDFGLQQALICTVRQFAWLGNPDLSPATRYARWFLDALTALGMVSAWLAAVSLFRPVAFRCLALPRERALARRILDTYGCGSYDYFKVSDDKSFFFTASKKTFVAYRTISGVALALGDPVGPQEEIEHALAGFVDFCRKNDWTVAFLMPERLELYEKLRLSLIKTGEEAIIDLDKFVGETSKKKYFRYVERKFSQEGYSVIQHLPPHSETIFSELKSVWEEWLSIPHRREYGFCQGRFDRGAVASAPIFALRDAEGRLIAFVTQVPSYRPGEGNFDLMRRRPGTHWGAMDYLFLCMLRSLHDQGFRTFNLGMAPFKGLAHAEQAALAEKVLSQAARRLPWLAQFAGLEQYKQKFEPRWEPRYFAYSGSSTKLPRVGLAVFRAM